MKGGIIMVYSFTSIMHTEGKHPGQRYWKHWTIMEYLTHPKRFIPRAMLARCLCAIS